jgi:hypothetical protein
MRKVLMILMFSLMAFGAATFALAQSGPGTGTCTGANCPGNPDCPDDDGDGVCNGQDPDYVPGVDCPGNPVCPDADGDGICNGQDPDYVPGAAHVGNPLCPDADGDGICNGQDPDYVPGPRRGHVGGKSSGWMSRYLLFFFTK